MIKELAKLADYLDRNGYVDVANEIDQYIVHINKNASHPAKDASIETALDGLQAMMLGITQLDDWITNNPPNVADAADLIMLVKNIKNKVSKLAKGIKEAYE